MEIVSGQQTATDRKLAAKLLAERNKRVRREFESQDQKDQAALERASTAGVLLADTHKLARRMIELSRKQYIPGVLLHGMLGKHSGSLACPLVQRCIRSVDGNNPNEGTFYSVKPWGMSDPEAVETGLPDLPIIAVSRGLTFEYDRHQNKRPEYSHLTIYQTSVDVDSGEPENSKLYEIDLRGPSQWQGRPTPWVHGGVMEEYAEECKRQSDADTSIYRFFSEQRSLHKAWVYHDELFADPLEYITAANTALGTQNS